MGHLKLHINIQTSQVFRCDILIPNVQTTCKSAPLCRHEPVEVLRFSGRLFTKNVPGMTGSKRIIDTRHNNKHESPTSI